MRLDTDNQKIVIHVPVNMKNGAVKKSLWDRKGKI